MTGATGDGALPRPLLLGMGWYPDQASGLDRYLRCLQEALTQAGAPCRTVVIGPAQDAPPSVQVASHALAPLPVRLLAFLRAARRSAPEADLIDVHFALYALLPLRLTRLGRLPMVVHFQGPWAEESRVTGQRGLGPRVKAAIERSVYRRADRLVVLSPHFKRVLVQDYGVLPSRVVVLEPGVDGARFRPGDRREARARLGVEPGSLVVTCVRRLTPRTGLDVLLRAWAQVAHRFERAVLLVCGDGPQRSELEALAAEIGVAGSVRFLGRTDEEDLLAAYQAADLSVVPTVALEGFGLVTLESLSCGTPVVVSDVDGLAEAPRRLDPTSVVPPGDTGALGRRLVAALDGTQALPDAGTCRAFAEGYGWEAVAARHLDLYRGLGGEAELRLRVVYLDHVARLSGGELALLRTLPALTDVEAHVILAEDGPLVGELEEADISVEVMPLSPAARTVRRDSVRLTKLPLASVGATSAYVVRLARRLQVLRPDLVHTHSLKAGIYGTLAARLAGVPAVWDLKDRIAADYLPPTAARLVRGLVRHLPRAVVADSETTLATVFSAEAAVGPIRVAIPHPVVTDHPAWGTRPPDAAPLRIGMVGRVAPWKGQTLFLEAFARAFRGEATQAVVVGAALFGEDDYERSLEPLAESLGIAGQVELRGHRRDVALELASFDVLVHASLIPEPFGQVVAEGMAAGLAVVAPAAGGPAEIIRDGEDGLLVPPGDSRSLSGAMRRLADDPALRARLGGLARERVARFTPSAVASEVMSVYRRALSR